ncbi:MAG: hypothetical protein ACI9XO_001982 [Paraglaciecola sp.]
MLLNIERTEKVLGLPISIFALKWRSATPTIVRNIVTFFLGAAQLLPQNA